MKFAMTCKLPNNEQRLKSPAWLAFKTNLDRAILNLRIKDAKRERLQNQS